MNMPGDAYRKGAKTGNRAPLQTERVRAGLAKLPALVPSSLYIGDDEIAAALRYCANLATWNANPRRIAKRANRNAATHPDMIENNGA